jgi:ligand-binding SRPBCC domain-containing protein
MPRIHLTTFIVAPIQRVFDLSRSISLHKIAAVETNEQAVAGITAGLISESETVTWQAKHFYKTRRFTSRIADMVSPDQFTDIMLHGDFKCYRHEHHFKSADNGTIMIDLIDFETPYGILGKLFNGFYLTHYLEKFAIKKNALIKEYAETEKWKAILD